MSVEKDSVPKVVDRRRFRPDGEPAAEEAEVVPAPRSDPSLEAIAPPAGEADERLAAQAARIDELTRAYAALVEDNKAFRARVEREKARALEAERAEVAQALLDAADEMERALAAMPAGAGSGTEPLATLAAGVKLGLAGLARRIAALGAVRLDVVGQRFDPRLAEAVDVLAVAEPAQDGLVLEEVRGGYRIGERVLRPARVRVGRLAHAQD
jgi:molecular chaperone GrpE